MRGFFLTLFYSCSNCKTLKSDDPYEQRMKEGWAVLAILSVMFFILSPLLRENIEATWGSVSVLVFSAVGLCQATYGNHHGKASISHDDSTRVRKTGHRDPCDIDHQHRIRSLSLRIHLCISILFLMASIDMAVDLIHDQLLGPEVIISGIAMVVSMAWVGTTFVGYQDMKVVMGHTKSIKTIKNECQRREAEGEKWLEWERQQ